MLQQKSFFLLCILAVLNWSWSWSEHFGLVSITKAYWGNMLDIWLWCECHVCCKRCFNAAFKGSDYDSAVLYVERRTFTWTLIRHASSHTSTPTSPALPVRQWRHAAATSAPDVDSICDRRASDGRTDGRAEARGDEMATWSIIGTIGVRRTDGNWSGTEVHHTGTELRTGD